MATEQPQRNAPPSDRSAADEHRRRTAYHESGHALVGMLTSDAEPVRKVSIVRRGQAFAITVSTADPARFNYKREELEAKIRVALGGRCAEELVFGQPSAAAQRSLVLVDDEVRRIVEESHTAALVLLRENRWRLDALAAALLRYESLDQSMAYSAAGLPEPGSAPGSLTAAAFGVAPAAA